MQIIIKFKLISLLNYATNKTKNKESPQQFWLKTARSYNLLFASFDWIVRLFQQSGILFSFHHFISRVS